MRDTKFVTGKNLKVGQKIDGWKIDGRRSMCNKIVLEVTPFKIRVAWRKNDLEGEWVDADAMFEVELTEEEFHEKYRKDAIEIQIALQNRLLRDEIGYHEMWNSWISYDPYELASNCREENIRIIGYTEDIIPKRSWFGEELDVGICAESRSGKRFWCHTTRETLGYLRDKEID